MDVAALSTKQIDDKALELLQAVFGDVDKVKLPIDLNQVARHCNLTIRQGIFNDQDLEGALDRKTRTVFLAANDSFEGKNFALAHELGHLKLHEGVNTDLFTMHQLENLLIRQGEDPKEDQADMFAASLLMPEKLVKALWEVTDQNIESFAKIFGVPEVAAKFRLKKLGLI